MEEEDMVAITLKSLPRAYEHYIKTLNIKATDVDFKFGELCNKLLQQDRWKKQFGNSETEGSKQTFVTNVKGKGRWGKKTSQGSGEDVAKSSKTITCHYCGKVGHMKKHCRKRLANLKSNPGGPQQKAHVAEHTKEELAFNAFGVSTQANQPRSSAWYIDSGASQHFTNRQDWCTKYTPSSSKDSVTFDGGEEFAIVGTGNVQLSFCGENAHVPKCLVCTKYEA